MKRRLRLILPSVLPILIFAALAVLVLTGVYRCPMPLIFGIPCPGCGMTHAVIALLSFDIRAAFGYHPLFPIPIIWAVYVLFIGRRRENKRIEAFMTAVSVLLFLIRWIIIL